MNKITITIRLILSAALLFGAYKETGVYSTLIFFLVFLNGEILTHYFNTKK